MKEPRNCKLQIRLSEAERDSWRVAAKEDGFEDVAPWLRKVGNRAASATGFRPDPREGDELNDYTSVDPPHAKRPGVVDPSETHVITDGTSKVGTFEFREVARENVAEVPYVEPYHQENLGSDKLPLAHEHFGAVDHDDTSPEPEDPYERLPTGKLDKNCFNAQLHWRLSAGETCQHCGGVA